MKIESTIIIFIISLTITVVGALTIDNVGRYQLNAMYNCNIQYTQIQKDHWCRNDTFGSMYDGGQ